MSHALRLDSTHTRNKWPNITFHSLACINQSKYTTFRRVYIANHPQQKSRSDIVAQIINCFAARNDTQIIFFSLRWLSVSTICPPMRVSKFRATVCLTEWLTLTLTEAILVSRLFFMFLFWKKKQKQILLNAVNGNSYRDTWVPNSSSSGSRTSIPKTIN